ncbi:hypothetical protein [Enterococcus asini]|uniref:Type II toxin-antitoxin system HicB family antitoxin n=1 Tax=Enterococcus asini TaxID=57732 RepID=A0AAW8U0S4_9ENTE|nr:hypothetical protein [Enterococcus asini]MDT2811291.1 hypothetical protein [Enterococcus asini]
MYKEQFEALQLNVVELPVELEEGLPVYRGFIRELPFLSGSGYSLQEMYRQLAEAYQLYWEQQTQQEEKEAEEQTTSLLSYEDILKYYDGETFDGFAISTDEEE